MITQSFELIGRFGSAPVRKKDVTELVIHHTQGTGDWKNLLTGWYLSPNLDKSTEKLFKKFIGFCHYYIEKKGFIYQAFPLNQWMFHSCSGKHDEETIGVELFHLTGDFTEEQYKSIVEMVDAIVKEYPNLKTIVSHDYNFKTYSKRTKGCPSKFFKWDKLKGLLEEAGYDFNYKYLPEELNV